MKKVIILLIGIIVGSMNMSYGQKRTAEDRAKRETEWMTKELKLTDAQKKQVSAANLEMTKAIKKARSNGDRDEMRETVKKLNDDRMKKFEKILTEDQFKKYKTLLKERRQNRKRKSK